MRPTPVSLAVLLMVTYAPTKPMSLVSFFYFYR